MKNGVERGPWIGAKEVVKSYKPVHISNIASKLLTGQGLINGRKRAALSASLPVFFTRMMNCAESDTIGGKLFTLSENVLIPAQK